MQIPKPLARLVHNHRLPIRHVDLHIAPHTDRNEVVEPARGQEGADCPGPERDGRGDGDEEGGDQEEEVEADPEGAEEEGSREAEEEGAGCEDRKQRNRDYAQGDLEDEEGLLRRRDR